MTAEAIEVTTDGELTVDDEGDEEMEFDAKSPDARESCGHFFLLWASTITTAVANFGVQYNYDSIGPAEVWLHPLYGKDSNYDLLLKVIIFIGTAIGMISFGAAGDLFGRNRGLLVCQYIQIAGALLQGIVPWGSKASTYCLLIAVRTFIGVGAGGVYPLSAAKAAEDSAAVDPVHKSVSVAWAFLWRNFGAIAPWSWALVFYCERPRYEPLRTPARAPLHPRTPARLQTRAASTRTWSRGRPRPQAASDRSLPGASS